ncbi:MAG: hypothetical protein AAFX09_01815 [Pseudomonadota bacterium]
MKRFALIPVLALMAGCATMNGETAPVSPAAADAQRLAAALTSTAAQNPDRLDRLRTDMRRLETALMASEAAPSPMPRPAPPHITPRPAPMPPPPLSGSVSLLHGVHLASYRRAEHVEAGWAELQSAHGELAGLQPRVEAADLGERGVYLRLKAGPFDSHGEARAMCAALSASGQYCAPSDYTGNALN